MSAAFSAGQAVHDASGVFDHRREQGDPAVEQGRGFGMAEADAVEIELQRQAVAGDHRGGQRIVGPLDEADIAEGDAAGLPLQGGCDGIILEHEQAVERRLVGGQPCPAPDIDKADGVVFLQGGKPLLNVAQPVAQALRAGDGQGTGEGVDEQPDHAFRAGEIGGTAGYRQAEHRQPAGAVALQQQRPGG